MKKLLLLLLVLPFVFASCSSDDDNDGDVSLTKEQVVGVWNISEADGESIPSGAIQIRLNSDDSYSVKFLTDDYIGTYTVSGNTVKGITLDPITEYYKFDSLNGNSATISYSNSDGDKYKFKATKQ